MSAPENTTAEDIPCILCLDPNECRKTGCVMNRRRDETTDRAAAALTLLAAKFDREAEGYRRKVKGRAVFYEDMAAAIRNHIGWVLERLPHEGTSDAR